MFYLYTGPASIAVFSLKLMQQSCVITDSSKIFPNFLFELSSTVFFESTYYLGNKETSERLTSGRGGRAL